MVQSYEKTSEKPKIKQKNPTLFLHFPHFFSTFVPHLIIIKNTMPRKTDGMPFELYTRPTNGEDIPQKSKLSGLFLSLINKSGRLFWLARFLLLPFS